jgi:hypothetical protein
MKSIGKLAAFEYGIMVFSPGLFNEYIKQNKIKAKKYISYFNKNKEFFYKIIKDGIIAPFYLIPYFEYNIFVKINEKNNDMPKGYRKVFEYDDFYIEIDESEKLCFASFYFMETGIELIKQNIMEQSELVPTGPKDIIEQRNYVMGVEMETGKYNFNLIGLERINKNEEHDDKNNFKNYGYLFEFIKNENAINDNFNKCDNDKYEFSIIKHKK